MWIGVWCASNWIHRALESKLCGILFLFGLCNHAQLSHLSTCLALSNTLNWMFFIYFIGQNMRVETSVSCNFEFFNGNWIEIVSKMPTWMLISKMVADFQQSISYFLFPTWRICSRLGCNCQKCLFLGNLSYLMLVYNILFLRLWFSYYVVSYKIAPEWIERQQCYCDFEVHPFCRSYREWNIQFCQNDLLLLFFIVNITRDSKTHKSYLILRQS